MDEQSNSAVNVSDIPKSTLLAALYNAASPKGYGFLQYTATPMTEEEAAAIITERQSKGFPLKFDYLLGRAMKIDISGSVLDARSYDRANGVGAAAGVVFTVLAGLGSWNQYIAKHHKANTTAAAEVLLRWIDGPASSSSVEAVGVAVVNLGFGEGADELRPRLIKALMEGTDGD